MKHVFTSAITQEIDILSQLQHIPGIVTFIEYFDLGPTNGYIVMEKIDNVIDLFDYISEQKTVVECKSRIIFVQLLDILTWCKKSYVFHGDIKDENILIDPNSLQITLIDFGSASKWSENNYYTNTGTKICSPPEWFRLHYFTADNFTVWSLGILLYNMLFGNIPFSTRNEIISKQICINNKDQKISKKCTHLLYKCLEKNVKNRILFASLKFHPWILSTMS